MGVHISLMRKFKENIHGNENNGKEMREFAIQSLYLRSYGQLFQRTDHPARMDLYLLAHCNCTWP